MAFIVPRDLNKPFTFTYLLGYLITHNSCCTTIYWCIFIAKNFMVIYIHIQREGKRGVNTSVNVQRCIIFSVAKTVFSAKLGYHQANGCVPIPSPIARFMGPTWGPSGADSTQVGPMLAPWTLLSGIWCTCRVCPIYMPNVGPIHSLSNVIQSIDLILSHHQNYGTSNMNS